MAKFSRAAALATAPDVKTWPRLPDSAIKAEDIEKVQLRIRALEMYIDGTPSSEIETVTGVKNANLSRFMQRCLKLAPDGQIFGFRALVPGLRLKAYERQASLASNRKGRRGGCSGSFGALCNRYPSILHELIILIKKTPRAKTIHEFKIQATRIHAHWIKLLRESGVSEMEYPFTQKWRGLRTIQKFVKEAIENNFSTAVATREGSEARARSNVGMGENAILRFDEPFDAVEIDAQRIDAEFCVTFFTPEGTEQRLSLERLWILAAVCRSNSCILAIKVVYANAVTANDVVSLIRLAVASTWEPRNLSIPGLAYLREGGMPSGVIPEAAGAIWGVLFLDGALAHLADAIQQEVRGLLGFAINYGAVGRFERRPNVERTFEEITKNLFQRLPSTTGSRPHLGREPKAREKAIQFDINVNDVEELLDVTATSHNGFPSSGLSNMSPLDHVRFHITGDWPRTLVRRLPECSAERAKFFTLRLKKKVRGNTKSGTRPYVELDGARYTNPILAEAANLIGTDIFVDVDENDYRQIKAYLANGSEIGFLIAQGRWGETKHDRKTRKAINSLRNQRMLVMTSMDDPVQVYLKYLAEKRASNKAAKVSIPPKRATEALRVAKNAGNQNVVMSTPKEPTTTITPPRLSDVRTVEPASSMTKLLLLKIGNRR